MLLPLAMSASKGLPRSGARAGVTRRARRLALALVVLALPPGAIAIRAARSELMSDFRPPKSAPSRPSSPDLAGMRDVSFEAGGVSVRGWLLPSRSGAAVLLLHGAGADRSQMVPEARFLGQRGIGVLLYDSPGHGESAGTVTWDAAERAAAGAALDRLSEGPGVDPRRLGILGFSMGSIIAARVAASDPRVRAVALTGAIHDFREQLRWAYSRWGALGAWPAEQAARYAGMDLDSRRPLDVIGAIAPRPLLLVAGDADTVVPVFMTRALFDAAGEPKRLLVLPGITHGHYHDAPASDYDVPVAEFFEAALGPGSPAPP